MVGAEATARPPQSPQRPQRPPRAEAGGLPQLGAAVVGAKATAGGLQQLLAPEDAEASAPLPECLTTRPQMQRLLQMRRRPLQQWPLK